MPSPTEILLRFPGTRYMPPRSPRSSLSAASAKASHLISLPLIMDQEDSHSDFIVESCTHHPPPKADPDLPSDPASARSTQASSIGSRETSPRKLHFLPSIQRQKTYLGEGSFKFLNKERNLGRPVDWNATGCSHLWQYNLHYFDYLHQQGIDRSTGFELIWNWIKGHPVTENGVGWEPYPTSLRLVNWIKFCSLGDGVTADIEESLMLQAVNLQNRIEYHLLGNHLWANGKALWIAGTFLGMERMADVGRRIVSGELKEQFLSDGGHFELSPMYHSIILEDLLDLINLCQASNAPSDAALLPILQEIAEKSLAWLQGIVDEEGNIPLLNDSAHGVAPRFDELRSYAPEARGIDDGGSR